MAPFLAVEDLSKTFGGLRAVDRCSLEVREGTITGLIGPNGAGKTTLFNLLTGFHRPDSGRVRFRGDDITGLPAHKVFRRGICRTFQIPREFKDLSVLENLMVVAPDQAGERLWVPWLQPGRVRRDETRLRERAMVVLEQVGLARLAGDPAWTLSGGQKKLLELARTLMAEPALLMLDEPGAGVNPTQITFYTWMAMIIGGPGSTRGALWGTAILVAVLEGTRFAKDVMPMIDEPRLAALRQVAIGLGLIVMTVYVRKLGGRSRPRVAPATVSG